MTKETMKFSEETNKFNHAVDLCFGMLPEKRFWILVMLYLSKERVLRIVDNLVPWNNVNANSYNDRYWHIMAYLCIDDISDQVTKNKWRKEGITSRFVWADIPSNLERFVIKAYGQEVASQNHMHHSDIYKYKFLSSDRRKSEYEIEIAEIFISLSDDWFKENASWAFETILRRIQSKYDREFGMFSQPKEVTDLVGKLLNANQGTVYNPYAGLCSYASVISREVQYYAQEIHPVYLFGKLRLLFLNQKKNWICNNENSLRKWKAELSQFEYIVSTPPFGLRCPDSMYRTAELDFLARSSRDARIKSVGVYAASICYNSNSINRDVFAQLIEDDILESVTLLPPNIFSTTAIETVIIVVNRRKERAGIVRFVDASDCFVTEGRYNKLEIDKVNSKLVVNSTALGVADISNEEIRSNDYKVYPKFYGSTEEITFPEGYHVVELGDIIESCPASRRFDEKEGHLVKIAEMSNSGIDCERTVDSFGLSDNLSHAVKIEEPVLLFSTIRDIKPTFCVASTETPLYVNPSISSYRIKAGCDWVSPKYLCYELTRRVGNITIGIIPRISREFLLKTKIGFPSFSIEEQELVVKEAFQQLKLAQAKEMGLQDVIDSMKANYINEVRTRKHDMRPYLRDLGSVERMMRRYLDNSATMSDFQQKMFDLLDKYNIALERLSNLIEVFSEEDQFGNAEPFNIDQYFIELKNAHDAESAGYKLNYERDLDALNESGLMNKKVSDKEISILNGLISFKYEKFQDIEVAPIFVDIAPIDFERMVRNIIENAREHGFTNPAGNIYELEINLSIDVKRAMYKIDFVNNGTPIPSGMNKLRYGIRGEKAGRTGGTGKGGYIVKSIVEHYNGDYDIFMDDEKTIIRIMLPISKQNDE